MKTPISLRTSLLILLLFIPIAYFALPVFDDPEAQLWLTRVWMILLFTFIISRWLTRSINPWQEVKKFLFEPASPYNLAVFRILNFSWYFIAIVFFRLNVGKKMTMGYEYFSPINRVAIPWTEWYSLHFPVTPGIIDTLAPIFNISAVCMFLGLFTRFNSIVFATLCFYLLSVHEMFGKVGCPHHLLWFPALLAFSDCSRVLSIDAFFRKHVFKRNIDVTPSVKYGFPLKAAMVLLGIIYFFPGFWKLWGAGFDWIFLLNLKYQMYVKWASMNFWLPFFRIDLYPFFLVLCSILVVAFEIGFIFLITKSTYRLWLVLGGILMHTAIYIFMKISFFVLWTAYPPLIDWENIYSRFRKKKQNIIQEKTIIPSLNWNDIKQIKGISLLFIVLLIGNILAGIRKVQSYPFTCYPTFSYMVPHESDRIYYEAYCDGNIRGENEQIKKLIFKYRPAHNLQSMEDRLMNNYYLKDSNQLALCVQQIFSFPNTFEGFDSIAVYKIKTPLSPEQRNNFIEQTKIGTFDLCTLSFHPE